MRLFVILAALAAILAFAAGCGQQKADTASNQTPTPAAEQPAESHAQEAMQESPPPEGAAMKQPPEGVEFASMTLTGKVGCGHCTYHATESCALAMQTEDGKVYVVESAPNYDAAFGDRFSGKTITATGKVGEVDGKWVVYAEQLELQ
jgi:hypothetical protein